MNVTTTEIQTMKTEPLVTLWRFCRVRPWTTTYVLLVLIAAAYVQGMTR